MIDLLGTCFTKSIIYFNTVVYRFYYNAFTSPIVAVMNYWLPIHSSFSFSDAPLALCHLLSKHFRRQQLITSHFFHSSSTHKITEPIAHQNRNYFTFAVIPAPIAAITRPSVSFDSQLIPFPDASSLVKFLNRLAVMQMVRWSCNECLIFAQLTQAVCNLGP